MSGTALPARARRPRRRAQLAPRLARWTMLLVSVYWGALVARACLWVYLRVMGPEGGRLETLYRWLGWPFADLPRIGSVPLLPDIVGAAVAGALALGVLGVLAGWSQERARRPGRRWA
ncbi:MAG: hypothetical protein RMK01_08235 [Thermomicrobium sp.]|nr:hypothetical protein [Thermomicrobium sp.]MDW8060046.1 hypothetical protein [Thermomicrobium sp.]